MLFYFSINTANHIRARYDKIKYYLVLANAMQNALMKFFQIYSQNEAPFMHQQLTEWSVTRPLAGLRILHHVPVVVNTLLKIACLIEAGADVTVTNPSDFCHAHPRAVSALKEANVRYVETPLSLVGDKFDLYYDCGAQLYQFLGAPKIGAIELTGSGDDFYRHQDLDFPVISIDRTLTKQLETVFGCAESSHMALTKLTGIPLTKHHGLFSVLAKLVAELLIFVIKIKFQLLLSTFVKHKEVSPKNSGYKPLILKILMTWNVL